MSQTQFEPTRVDQEQLAAHAIEVLESISEPLTVDTTISAEDGIANMRYHLEMVVKQCDALIAIPEFHPGLPIMLAGIKSMASASLGYIAEWGNELQEY
jgi:hypothetical protein